MRTTLTLDDDVAALLKRVLTHRKASLKAVVNQALRDGLRSMLRRPRPGTPYRTEGFDAGRCLIGSLDDIAEVLGD